MFSSAVLRSEECRVPLAFVGGPGEDTAVSLALTAAGFHIVYCANAAAIENVSVDRLSRSWVLDRAIANGAAWKQLAKSGLVPVWKMRLYVLKAFADIGQLVLRAWTTRDNAEIFMMRARRQWAFIKGALGIEAYR